MVPVPSKTTTWASIVSPAATPAGTPTVTLVTVVVESVKALAPTNVMLAEAVAVAVGEAVAVGTAPCCTVTFTEVVPRTVLLAAYAVAESV